MSHRKGDERLLTRAQSLPQIPSVLVKDTDDEDEHTESTVQASNAGSETDLEEENEMAEESALNCRAPRDPTKPLSPKVLPTFKSQNLSPFWFTNSAQGKIGADEKKAFGFGTMAIEEMKQEMRKNKKKSKNKNSSEPVKLARAPQFSWLHAAAITGDKAGLQNVASGNVCDIDLLDKFGRTPLMFAVLGDYPECVEILLKYGSQASLKDNSGRTALHWAAHHGNAGCLKALLQKKDRLLSWTEEDQGGVTILHLATRHPSRKCLQLVFKYFSIGAGEIDFADKNKRTALHWAASQGYHEYCRLLLKNGASVGLIDVEGKTPLHWAASSGSSLDQKRSAVFAAGDSATPLAVANLKESDPAKCVQVLMDAGEKVLNWQDYEGRVALHLAVADSHSDVVSVLLNNDRCQINALDNNFRSSLHWAALLGKTETCKILLDHHARYHCQDAHGGTPLHYAVDAGNLETVEMLMARSEVEDYPDLQGRTAFIWAAGKGDWELLKVMFAHGAKIEFQDHAGATALHVAVAANQEESVDTLISLGVDLTAVTKSGHTPLFIAAQHGHSRMARKLLEATDDQIQMVNELDPKQRHVLHWACQEGHLDFVRSLFELCGDQIRVDVADIYGRTPLILAAHGGYVECMKMLLRKGCRLRHRDNEFMCALHWATLRGHLDAVKLLLAHGAYPNYVASRVGSSEAELSRFTPLDSAAQNEHNEIVECLLQHVIKGVTLKRLEQLAATKIQALYRGYRIRRDFNRYRELIIRHEELRAKKRVRRVAKTNNGLTLNPSEERVNDVAGSFLHEVVVRKHLADFHKREEKEKQQQQDLAEGSSSAAVAASTVDENTEKKLRKDDLKKQPSASSFVEVKSSSSLALSGLTASSLSDVPLSAIKRQADGTGSPGGSGPNGNNSESNYSYNFRVPAKRN